MEVNQFLKTINAIKDPKWKECFEYACGKVNPFKEPEKFKNMRKDNIIPKNLLTKYVKKALYMYFRKCAAEAYQKYPKNVEKLVTLELKLKSEAIPKAIKYVQEFDTNLTSVQICKIGCKVDFGCNHDFASKACSQNFCKDCSKQF